jgi:hypothetical protein
LANHFQRQTYFSLAVPAAGAHNEAASSPRRRFHFGEQKGIPSNE